MELQTPASNNASSETGDKEPVTKAPGNSAQLSPTRVRLRSEEADSGFWKGLVRKISRRIDQQDAEDALHNAWLRLDTFRRTHQVDNAEAFLARTARNVAIDSYRRQSLFSDKPLEDGAIEMSDPFPLQDEVIEVRNRLQRVKEGLAKLPPRTREVFEMHRLDGLKYREIAKQLGISQSAVEKHIAKAALFLGEWTKGW